MGTGSIDRSSGSGVNKVPADMTPGEFSESIIPALAFMINMAQRHGLERLVTTLTAALEVAKERN